MNSETRFVSDEYAFIAGPGTLSEPIDSQNVFEIAEHPIEEVLATLLSLPRVRQIGSEASLTGWATVWESGDRLILFERPEELGDVCWVCLGVWVRCDCRVGDVLNLWERVRRHYSGFWLIGPDSWLLTPASFAGRITFQASWRTFDVVALANGIRTQGAFDRLPILADALQDAGCDSSEILDHCRDATCPHTCGCWVVDLVLA